MKILQYAWLMVFAWASFTYLSFKVAMPLVIDEHIVYHCIPPSPKGFFQQSLFFYPFVKIHKTTFMHVLHIMDQSWRNEDLNDGGSRFCNILIWGHDDMGRLPWNLKWKKDLVLKAWMILSEWNVIDLDLWWWRNKFFAILTYSNLAMHQGSPLVKVHYTIVCKYCNTFLFEVIVWIFYHSNCASLSV